MNCPSFHVEYVHILFDLKSNWKHNKCKYKNIYRHQQSLCYNSSCKIIWSTAAHALEICLKKQYSHKELPQTMKEIRKNDICQITLNWYCYFWNKRFNDYKTAK